MDAFERELHRTVNPGTSTAYGTLVATLVSLPLWVALVVLVIL